MFKDYSTIRSDLTKGILLQTEGPDGQQMVQRIILSLVDILQPVRSGEISLEEYQLSVNRNENETWYDMTIILPALKSWPAAQADPLTEKALVCLKNGYDLA